MTEREAIRAFRKHWKTLSLTGTRNKKVGIPAGAMWSNDCALCQYVLEKFGGCVDGSKCPIRWPQKANSRDFACVGSLYFDWNSLYISEEERAKIALKISRLPAKNIKK